MSWARLGAKAMGVDFSDAAIDLAGGLNEEMGLDVRFIRGNIYDLPDALQEQFDIVFTSYGVLCWLPDIVRWAQVVSNHLKPGGVFYMVEFHPFATVFEASESGDMVPAYRYFHEELFLEGGVPSYAGTQTIETPTYEWQQSLGEIVCSLIDAGLRIEFLHEFPFTCYQAHPVMKRGDDGWWRLPKHNDSFPQMFSIRARKLGVADVGGPLMEIARFSGAKIVGVNSNAYQLDRARKLTEEAELTHLAEFIHCDFLAVDAPDESFDAVYSIEATCCAPDKLSIYGEVFRLLKPGARFGVYEFCMTDRFDSQDPIHLKLKADLQLGGGLLNIDERQTVDDALRTVGFEVLQTRDLAEQTGPSIPWYQPLVGSGLSFASFRSSRIGRHVTHNTLRVLETLRVAPKGTVQVSQTLNLCAAAMAEAGRLGIFTPMYFIHARKPE